MANLTIGLAMAGLASVGLSGIFLQNSLSKTADYDVVILGNGRKASPGAVIRLLSGAASKYPGKGLTQPGTNYTGTLQYIERQNPKGITISVSNTVRGRRFTGVYDPSDFILVKPSNLQSTGGVKITNGIATVGTQVRYKNANASENSSPKSLANPFYNSVGVVESIDPQTSKIFVKATALKDVNMTFTQEYDANDLIFVSLPHEEDLRGIPNEYGFINVGSRVSLTPKKYSEAQTKSSILSTTETTQLGNLILPVGQKPVSNERFLASPRFEKIGVVTVIFYHTNGMPVAAVKCKQVNSNHYYEQLYFLEDLQVIGSDGIPPNTVFILGGVASNGVAVKLRDEKKEASAGKALTRPTYGLKGTVEDVDPNADDNLKVQVRSVGTNAGEEASDWYEPEHLEIIDMPTDQGIPVFGGFANVGTVVEVMVDARGIKCLGKPEIGNIGVVMGLDQNASGGETLNIKCGRDLKTNTKASNWYKPTDVKLYIKPDVSGTQQERLEIQLIRKRSQLLQTQRISAKDSAEAEIKAQKIDGIKTEIDELEKKIEEEKKKGTSLEGMRELYTRLMEELVKFRRSATEIDKEYSVAKLDTTCNISDVSTESLLRKESEYILLQYYDPQTILEIITPAPPYIADVPSADPADLKRLEDAAQTAIEAYNRNKTPALKTAADDAMTALKTFKERRQYQAPQTNSQKSYVKKRDNLVAALDSLQTLVRAVLSDRAINLGDRSFTNFPAIVDLRLAGSNYDNYKAYLVLVEQIELAKNTNPEDPVGHVAGLVPAPRGAVALNGYTTPANCAAAVAAADALAFAAQSPQKIARDALEASANAANPALPGTISKCKLAAYDLLVAVVDNSTLQGLKQRFITSLYWNKKYKDSTTKLETAGDFLRKFDVNDVYLRKLNEARSRFDEILEPTPDTQEAQIFRKLKDAFAEFDSARRSIYDEVHGEITDLEKQIKIMIEYKKRQTINLYKFNSEMIEAQDAYSEAIKKEKFADFLLMNAFIKRKQETDKYLTIIKPNTGDSRPQKQQGGPPPGRRDNRGGGQHGGAISSAEREINYYLAKIFTNYIRINHYKSIILRNNTLSLSSVLVKGTGTNPSKLLSTKIKTLLKQIFVNTNGNNPLYSIVPLTRAQQTAIQSGQATIAQQVQDLLAERTRLLTSINASFPAADTIIADINTQKPIAQQQADSATASYNTSLAAFNEARNIVGLEPALLAAVTNANTALATQSRVVTGTDKPEFDASVDKAQRIYEEINKIKQTVTNSSTDSRQIAYSVRLLQFYETNGLPAEITKLQGEQATLRTILTRMQTNTAAIGPLEQATQDALVAAKVAAADRQNIATVSATSVKDAVIAAVAANQARGTILAAGNAAKNTAGNAAHATATAAGPLASVQPTQARAISDAAATRIINATQTALVAPGATLQSITQALDAVIGDIPNIQKGGGYAIRRPVFSKRNTRRVSRY